MVDSSAAYFIDYRETGPAFIEAAPLDGGSASVVATPTEPAPRAIVLANDSVYWTQDEVGQFQNPVCGAVYAQALGTDAGASLLTSYCSSFGGDSLTGLTLDPTTLYMSDGTATMTTPIDGGPVATIANNGGYSVIVDSTNVYWNDTFGKTISMVPKTGGNATVLVQETHPIGYGFAADADYLYFVVWKGGTGTIRKTRKPH